MDCAIQQKLAHKMLFTDENLAWVSALNFFSLEFNGWRHDQFLRNGWNDLR